jgi:3-oxoacyl-[acyl-carrier protein] reductase
MPDIEPTPRPQRVAIVTGASGGIGRAVLTGLAAAGQAVVAGYAGNRAPADEAVAEIERTGGEAIAVGSDISEEAGATALFDAAEERFGGVDVVVHAAGIMPPPTPLVETGLELIDRVLRINLRGTFTVVEQAMRRVRSGGAIVMFSSSVLGLALNGYAPYAASKGGIEAITPILARELRGRDITVNTVAPGPIATPLFLDGKDEKTIDWFAKQPPLERLGAPDDVAGLVAFLAGPGRWINGQRLRVNGGIV